MADWAAIRAAIATQMGAASSVKESLSTEATGVGSVPTVRVLHTESIEVDDESGGRGAGFESRIAIIKGLLLVEQSSDVGRAVDACEPIIEELFAAARLGIKLGYPMIVSDSWLDAAEVGDITFGGADWIGAGLTWVVKVREPVTRSAS
jgi:hypothetical protein